MHTRSTGPKQTIPARLVAGCDNQIENFVPLWGVRWTTPRPRRRITAKNLVHPTPPNTSDQPHIPSPPSSAPVPRSSSTPQLGGVASKSSAHFSPDTITPADATHSSGNEASMKVYILKDPMSNSSAAPAKQNVLTPPVPLHPRPTPRSLPKPELASARKPYRTCPHGPRKALPPSINHPHFPLTSGLPSVNFESTPTPFFLVGPVALPASDTFMSEIYTGTLPNAINDSAVYTDGDARVVDYHHDAIAHGFFACPPGYQLSSHSELAAFASDGSFFGLTDCSNQGSVASREELHISSQR